MTLPISLNNPGAIRQISGTIWEGQSAVQPNNGFVSFTDPIYGIRAIARILASYERQGIDTLGEAIDRWSPPNENNSAAYVADVCQRCGINSETKVSLMEIAPALIRAIIHHENGQQPYSDAEIQQGIEMAHD